MGLRILVVKLSSLGDVVHAVAAVQDMHRALPEAQIDWVVERSFAPLVQRCTGVGCVIACDLRRWRKAPFAAQTRMQWRAFRTELQAQAYDAVLDLQGLSKSALVAWLARLTPGGKRYAMANQTDGSGYEAPTRWVADVAIALEPHVHAVQRARLLCAKALGYTVQGAPQFGLRAQALAIEPSCSSRPCVALVHGTSRADKQWPASHWVELGQRLSRAGFGVLLMQGSAQERMQAQAIAAQLEHAQVGPDMGLDAVVDTLAACKAVIGVDSGLSHIAVALGLPHVQIYNFDTAWRTGPLAPQAGALQLSVYDPASPSVQAVWQAWEQLQVQPG